MSAALVAEAAGLERSQADQKASSPDTPQLGGAEKAAILLTSLGEGVTAEVLRRAEGSAGLKDRILRLIAEHRGAPWQHTEQVIREFRAYMKGAELSAQGGLDYAYRVLEMVDGRPIAEETIRRLRRDISDRGLARLRKADPENILLLVRAQHPQIGAVLLAHLEPSLASTIVAQLDEKARSDILYRMSEMDKVNPEMTEILERTIGSQALELGQLQSNVGGTKFVAEILNYSPTTLERSILEGIGARDADLAREIKQLMFVFADLMDIDDHSLEAILQNVDLEDLAKALRGVRAESPELKDRIMGAMTRRQAQALDDEMSMGGPIRVSDAEEAQARIIAEVRRLEEAGEIVLAASRGDDVLV